MLVNFDQNTLANMTAALECVCKKIPVEKDSQALRKKIADEIIACAANEKRMSSISKMPALRHLRILLKTKILLEALR